MSIADVLTRGRALAAELMADTCRITKPGVGKGTFNPTTGKYDAPARVIVYEGACRIPRRDAGANTAPADAGDATWAVGEYPLSLPFDAAGAADVAPGMTVEYLTAPNDAAMVGRTFGLVAVSRQTHATARRFRVKEVVG